MPDLDQLLDDEGNLFGAVNIVDALVVLFVLAVSVAGATFVFGSPLAIIAALIVVVAGGGAILYALPDTTASTAESPPKSLSATLDLGTQPRSVVAELTVGDIYTPTAASTIEITEIHVARDPDESTKPRVLLGVSLSGRPTTASDELLEYAGSPPQIGRTLHIQTPTYEVAGTIESLNGDSAAGTTEVVIESTVDTVTAATIEPGDTDTIGEHSIATIKAVTTYNTADPTTKHVVVGLTLNTHNKDQHHCFGQTLVQQGTNIQLKMPTYTLSGDIQRVGATTLQGNQATRTATLELEAPPQIAERLEVGLTDQAGDDYIAEITAIDRTATTVVLESLDGNIHERTHPQNQTLKITAELTVRNTPNGPRFKNTPLKIGTTIPFDFGEITVSPSIANI